MSKENDILKTAHIHLDQAIFRIHVADTDIFDCEAMTDGEDKPSYVLWISRSNDKTEKKTSLICAVCTDEYNLEEMAEWVSSHEKQNWFEEVKEERVVVKWIDILMTEGKGKDCHFYTNGDVPKDKVPLIKEAIEKIINNE